MKLALFVQARLTSKRFPKKIFSRVNKKTLLEILLNKLKKVKTTKKIIVLIPETKNNNKLESFLKKKNRSIVFRGSENDVLDRYYQAAKKYNIKNIIRITSDCPLIDVKLIDKITKKFLAGNYDYATNTMPPTYPHGMDVEIFKFSALESAWKYAKTYKEREHVTIYIRKKSKKILNIKNNSNQKKIRITLDWKEDLVLIKKIFNYFKPNIHIEMKDILNLKKRYPDWFKINKKRFIR